MSFESTASSSFNLDEYIMRHIQDAGEWHLPFLPVIKFPEFLSLHKVMILVCSLILILVFCKFYDKKSRTPKGLTNFLEVFVLFIRDQIAFACMGKKDGKRFTPLLCSLFFFILGCNLLGLIPLFSTATANINVTAGLALATLTVIFATTIAKKGVSGFFKTMMPHGVPVPILFLLVPIEFIGLFIKAFALMMRLFANMVAGHIIILSILGVIVTIGAVAMPAMVLAAFIALLETFVAFLQAYIFTFLSALFIGHMYQESH